jgi:hypothetical protein
MDVGFRPERRVRATLQRVRGRRRRTDHSWSSARAGVPPPVRRRLRRRRRARRPRAALPGRASAGRRPRGTRRLLRRRGARGVVRPAGRAGRGRGARRLPAPSAGPARAPRAPPARRDDDGRRPRGDDTGPHRVRPGTARALARRGRGRGRRPRARRPVRSGRSVRSRRRAPAAQPAPGRPRQPAPARRRRARRPAGRVADGDTDAARARPQRPPATGVAVRGARRGALPLPRSRLSGVPGGHRVRRWRAPHTGARPAGPGAPAPALDSRLDAPPPAFGPRPVSPPLVAVDVHRELDRAAERLGLPKITVRVARWR